MEDGIDSDSSNIIFCCLLIFGVFMLKYFLI